MPCTVYIFNIKESKNNNIKLTVYSPLVFLRVILSYAFCFKL